MYIQYNYTFIVNNILNYSHIILVLESHMYVNFLLDRGDLKIKISALKKVIQLILNGEKMSPSILMTVIRFVMPLEVVIAGFFFHVFFYILFTKPYLIIWVQLLYIFAIIKINPFATCDPLMCGWLFGCADTITVHVVLRKHFLKKIKSRRNVSMWETFKH